MRKILLSAALGAFGSVSSAQPLAVALTPATQGDVQCLVLFLVATGAASDEETKVGGTAGTMYFLGKIRSAAPTLDLTAAVHQELVSLQRNPATEAVGERCDAEIGQRGRELIELGEDLQNIDDQTPSSSSS